MMRGAFSGPLGAFARPSFLPHVSAYAVSACRTSSSSSSYSHSIQQSPTVGKTVKVSSQVLDISTKIGEELFKQLPVLEKKLRDAEVARQASETKLHAVLGLLDQNIRNFLSRNTALDERLSKQVSDICDSPHFAANEQIRIIGGDYSGARGYVYPYQECDRGYALMEGTLRVVITSRLLCNETGTGSCYKKCYEDIVVLKPLVIRDAPEDKF